MRAMGNLAVASAMLKRVEELSFYQVRLDAYTPGVDAQAGEFIAIDIKLLGETPADESLWRDKEECSWPAEVHVTARTVACEFMRTPRVFLQCPAVRHHLGPMQQRASLPSSQTTNVHADAPS